MKPEITNTYKIFCGIPDKKNFRTKMEAHYLDPAPYKRIVFTHMMHDALKISSLALAITKTNKVMEQIIDLYNVYAPVVDYELDEIDIDFTDKDFHWLK